MRVRQRLALLITAALLLASGCRSSSGQADIWPTEQALPAQPPGDLKQSERATSVLQRGSDGFLYLIGSLDPKAVEGAKFIARYSGEWPMSKLPRPPLAAGQVLRRYNDNIALVQVLYQLPEAPLEELEVTWPARDDASEELGKGIARVSALKPDARNDLELSIGENLGAQSGDMYALMASDAGDPKHSRFQMARRIKNICLVTRVEDSRAMCRIWRGGMHATPQEVALQDEAIFLEHTFGVAPRAAVLQLTRIKGDSPDNALRAKLAEELRAYLKTHGEPNATVEEVDLEVDPRDPNFHRYEHEVPGRGMAQMLIGGALIKIDGRERLILNYTSVGAAVGPGMIAAPPETGIDMGRVDELDGDALRGLFGVLWGSALVYRGQTSEALMQLRQVLQAPTLTGPLRWHARDQFAMRWASLGRVEQALWMVLEDEQAAGDDEIAALNALGTRVRLYDLLEQPDSALSAAREYLKRREAIKSGVSPARGMLAEMLAKKGDIDGARAQLDLIKAACPEGCHGELFAAMSGVYWAIPPEQSAAQDALLEALTPLARELPGSASATVWLYQGLKQLRLQDYDQALMAFLEAERLYRERDEKPGVVRAKYFAFMAHLARKDALRAYEEATAALELATELRDYGSAQRLYERMASIYLTLDPSASPEAFIPIATRTLTWAFEANMAAGDLARASESLFSIGNFLFRAGQGRDAQAVFQKAVIYALRTARFDVAALCHLTLALLARAEGDQESARAELERARAMAKLAKDPSVSETIERTIDGNTTEAQDAPLDTKLL